MKHECQACDEWASGGQEAQRDRCRAPDFCPRQRTRWGASLASSRARRRPTPRQSWDSR